MTSDAPLPRPARTWPCPVLWAVLFAVAHTQSPLYYSNQHQYMLHGLADAGVGNLAEDWLANTKDPTPVFSALVATSYRLFGAFSLQVIFFVLLVVYFDSVRRLVAAIPGFPDRGPAQVLFLALFVAAHAAIVRVAAIRLTGVDYPWYLQCGLANQYVLGTGLQPSAFGVLLLASLAAFVNGRAAWAGVLAATAAVMHSTYLLPAGVMVAVYLFVLWREGKTAGAWVIAVVPLLMVFPVIVYNVRSFSHGDPGDFEAAQMILAVVRIPHHADVGRWLDAVAGIQIAAMLVGLALVRRSRVFPVLALAASVGLVLTVVQVATRNYTLALLFPWRVSAVLMPLSTAMILTALARYAARPVENRESAGRVLVWACWIGVAALAAAGVAVEVLRLGYHMNDAELPLLDHVRDHKRPGDVYLLPVKFPTLKKESPAGQSKTFAPPVRPGAVGIPVDLQRFRLHTGAAIYVDFKAVPYAPSEVQAWVSRMLNCEICYDRRDWDLPAQWPTWEMARELGVTHVVTTADRDIKGSKLELEYSDASYRLYRIK